MLFCIGQKSFATKTRIIAARNAKNSAPFKNHAQLKTFATKIKNVVPSTGFEPASLATPPPQDGVSTNFTNWAYCLRSQLK